MKIGVFDSGIGGLSVVNAIKTARPDLTVIFKNDSTHVPYGNRQIPEIHGFVLPFLQSLVDDGCQVVVIACNTVSTNLITELRAELAVPIIAMEPMIKPATKLTKTNIIAVCATPLTLTSKRYNELKSDYAADLRVLEPDCSEWSYLIEQKRPDELRLETSIEAVIEQGADVIVLGCTHYHWIEERIQAICRNRAVVIQPELAIVAQLERVIGSLV